MQGKTDLGTFEYVEKDAEIPLIISEIERCKYIGLDTENSGGLDPLKDEVKLLLLQLEVNRKAYVIDVRKVNIHLLDDILTDRRWIKVIQNAIYDYKLVKHLCGISIRGLFDTKTAESLLQAGLGKMSNSLGSLAERYLEIKMNKETVMTFPTHAYDAPFTDEQLRYAADDVLVLPDIHKQQQMYLNQYGLNRIAELEFALLEPVAEMELTGVKLDSEMWGRSLDNTKKKLFMVSNELREVLPNPLTPAPKPPRLKKDGTPFANTAKIKPPPVLNLDSWQQLVTSFKGIGVDLEEVNKKTKRGPTNSSTIKFAQLVYHDSPEKVKTLKTLMVYRALNQVKKTFGDNLLEHIQVDGRIHARFHPNGTDSGRFSSTDPNLQNIQKKGEEGKILRSCFVPDKGCKYIIADYSQIELRIVAELSRDPLMLAILQDPKGDIHSGTASQMYKVPYDKVSGDLRRAAKTLNFGIIYGMMVKTLSERLNCSIGEADKALKLYNETYHVMMGWLEEEGNKAYNRHWSKTIGGRIRWFPTLDQKNFDTIRDFNNMVEYYKRVGRNHPVQGTSADMTKTAIVLLFFPLMKLGATIVNTIHDEICVEVPEANTIEVAKLVKDKMILAGQKYLSKVPVMVDVKIRDCWYKDDFDSAKLGIQDDEDGQQMMLLPNKWGLDEIGEIESDDDDTNGEE
uniref:Putative DNA polymerase n=1 Tax=viral metagenome TaxID=1070528 RepID=A0A6M3L6R8_9ZZZZ